MSILKYLEESLLISKFNLSPLIDYARNYESSEDLLRDGGFPIELLDKVAFGFSDEDIKTIDPRKLNIKWKDDLDNVLWEVKKSGLTPKKWSEKVDLSEPIDVSYSNGKFWIEDGHHRYYEAKTLGKLLNANVEITDKPIAKIMGSKNYNYDKFIRDIYNISQSKEMN